MQKKTVSLVLGSGGARGLSHIGVIRWLEENNYEIKSIAGCSIGSLIGGVHAAGKLDQLEEWMRSITKLDMASLLDFSWGSGGLFKGEKIINTLIDFLEDAQIEDLPIPFTAVAADIINEKEVWMTTGSLFEAIRASISLPLFFTPVKYKDTILIDGGVLNPVPIAPTSNDQTDLTVAVNLGGAPIKEQVKKEMEDLTTPNGGRWQREIQKFIQSFDKKDSEAGLKNYGLYEVADKAFDTMQSTIGRLKIAAYPPDVEIMIARNACGTLEFDRAGEMIELGYQKAKEIF
ncbi:MAG: patatin-like phospholipase family protein [Mangrovibacterium sp.]